MTNTWMLMMNSFDDYYGVLLVNKSILHGTVSIASNH